MLVGSPGVGGHAAAAADLLRTASGAQQLLAGAAAAGTNPAAAAAAGQQGLSPSALQQHQQQQQPKLPATMADRLADTGKAIEAAATLYDDYCRVITPENLLTEESEEVSG